MDLQLFRDKKIVTSYPFIFGLLLLVANDFLFKEIYGNWFTGKLSDFAGLFIFPLFWTALFPRRKVEIFWLTALIFVLWKSPYSQGVIDAWNSLPLFNINRVIDYSDLFALSMLPISFRFEKRNSHFAVAKIKPGLILIFTAFSFAATSSYTDVELQKQYEFDFSADTLAYKIYELDSGNNSLFLNQLYELDSAGKYYVHKYSDSAYVIGMNDSYYDLSDTVEMRIDEDFCFDGYTAEIAVSGNQSTSTIKLLGFNHRCPAEENDEKILLESFERKIIDPLRK